jgi:eukaryotic-like serine/threonine-protein kinase
VFEVTGTRLVVKLIDNASLSRREWLRNQLTFVKRLDLKGLSIARPLEMLREPHLGYVMELVTGMEPISRLIDPPRGKTSLVAWYRAGGGLRRRLLLLARIADLLNSLHAKGLVYGDISAKNIFVSSDPAVNEVCLIDADNIRFQSAPQSDTVYTMGYGAPELVRARTGVNSLTDAHSFAVLAFLTLVGTHPLIGDSVHDGVPELEEQALEGRLPWIDDPSDTSNRSTFGLERSLVISPGLSKLFQKTFSLGITHPLSRPGISKWVEVLHNAADATLKCSVCANDYFFSQQRCPWCLATRPNYLAMRVHLWDPLLGEGNEIVKTSMGKPLLTGGAFLSEGDYMELSARVALGLDGSAGTRPIASVTFRNGRATLTSLESGPYQLVSLDQRTTVPFGERPLVIDFTSAKTSWFLHFGHINKLHRVAVFRFHREVPA